MVELSDLVQGEFLKRVRVMQLNMRAGRGPLVKLQQSFSDGIANPSVRLKLPYLVGTSLPRNAQRYLNKRFPILTRLIRELVTLDPEPRRERIPLIPKQAYSPRGKKYLRNLRDIVRNINAVDPDVLTLNEIDLNFPLALDQFEFIKKHTNLQYGEFAPWLPINPSGGFPDWIRRAPRWFKLPNVSKKTPYAGKINDFFKRVNDLMERTSEIMGRIQIPIGNVSLVGNAILSKYPLTKVDGNTSTIWDIEVENPPYKQEADKQGKFGLYIGQENWRRNLMRVRIDFGDFEYDVVTTHLHDFGQTKLDQAQNAKEILEKEVGQFIASWDWNDVPKGQVRDTYRYGDNRGHNYSGEVLDIFKSIADIDAMRDVAPIFDERAILEGTYPAISHPKYPADRPIDVIWLGLAKEFVEQHGIPKVRAFCKAYQVLSDVYVSDHHPILAVYDVHKVIQLPTEDGRKTRKVA